MTIPEHLVPLAVALHQLAGMPTTWQVARRLRIKPAAVAPLLVEARRLGIVEPPWKWRGRERHALTVEASATVAGMGYRAPLRYQEKCRGLDKDKRFQVVTVDALDEEERKRIGDRLEEIAAEQEHRYPRPSKGEGIDPRDGLALVRLGTPWDRPPKGPTNRLDGCPLCRDARPRDPSQDWYCLACDASGPDPVEVASRRKATWRP